MIGCGARGFYINCPPPLAIGGVPEIVNLLFLDYSPKYGASHGSHSKQAALVLQFSPILELQMRTSKSLTRLFLQALFSCLRTLHSGGTPGLVANVTFATLVVPPLQSAPLSTVSIYLLYLSIYRLRQAIDDYIFFRSVEHNDYCYLLKPPAVTVFKKSNRLIAPKLKDFVCMKLACLNWVHPWIDLGATNLPIDGLNLSRSLLNYPRFDPSMAGFSVFFSLLLGVHSLKPGCYVHGVCIFNMGATMD